MRWDAVALVAAWGPGYGWVCMQRSKASGRFGRAGLGKWHAAPGLPFAFFYYFFSF